MARIKRVNYIITILFFLSCEAKEKVLTQIALDAINESHENINTGLQVSGLPERGSGIVFFEAPAQHYCDNYTLNKILYSEAMFNWELEFTCPGRSDKKIFVTVQSDPKGSMKPTKKGVRVKFGRMKYKYPNGAMCDYDDNDCIAQNE
jgi:hypothetical protein